MAIPPASPHPRTLRLALFASLAFGLISSLYAVKLWRDAAQHPPGHCPEPEPNPDCPTCEACSPPTPGQGPGALAATPPAPEPSPRYLACEVSGERPIVRVLALKQALGPLLGIHCGATLHLVGLDADQPRRIMRLEGLSGPAGLTPNASALLASDVSGDERSDLIVGTLLRDERGSPRGGRLWQLRAEASGAFAAPRLLISSSVGAAVVGLFEPSQGADIAMLQLEEARLARPDQLILVRGGPAPVKLLTLPALIGTRQLVATDLDLDGVTDLVLANVQQPAQRLVFDAQGKLLQRAPLEAPVGAAIMTADMDGDGHQDVVFAGPDARLLLATRDTEPATLLPLGSLDGWSSIQAMDWNGDGRTDLVGQHLQAVWGLIQTGPLTFEARELARLGADDLLHAVLPITTTPDAARALLLATSPTHARERVELQVARATDEPSALVRTLPLPDAPLSQRMLFP